jgi:acyl-CoA synthetase (AMP-forming)/AMP-acid ligase II
MQHFETYGEKPALIDGMSGRKVTYRDLLFRIGTAAKGFAARGIRDGDVVGIHMPNMPEYIVAFQAAASLGAVNTTSNPLYTATELNHQFKDSNAKYCITVPAFLDTVKAAAKDSNVQDIFVVGEPSGSFLFENDGKSRPSSVSMDPKEKLLVLPYSSGTTGLPKGTMLSHYNLVANVQQMVGHPEFNVDLRNSDVCMGLLPMYHIYGKP